jgi:hypothetical protein
MNTEIKEGSRVRVALYRKGYHVRDFIGTCKGWTTGGKCRVVEDGKTKPDCYNPDHVKLVKQ